MASSHDARFRVVEYVPASTIGKVIAVIWILRVHVLRCREWTIEKPRWIVFIGIFVAAWIALDSPEDLAQCVSKCSWEHVTCM